MGGKSVCLSVCPSVPSSTFPVARLWTLTAAFESLGLGYVPPTLLPTCSHGQPKGVEIELPSLFPADSVMFVSTVLSFAATSGE